MATLKHLVTVSLVAVLAALVFVESAAPARQPTLRERTAITMALPASLQHHPIGCVYLAIALSADGRFAKVTPEVFYPAKKSCISYASNGFYFLRKTIRWKVIFNGSVPPPCALRIPRDLVAPMACTR